MNEDTQQSWEKYLNPEVLRANLIEASIYITAFEMLKETIVERIRDFYFIGFDDTGIKTDPKYYSEVLSENKSPIYASLHWLKQSNAIGDDDILAFERVKQCRNTIVHELNHMLAAGLPPDLSERFSEIVSLLNKIEKWWIVNVEIPTNPDLAEKEIIEEEIVPGPILGLRMLLDIALGSEEDARFYFNEFRKHTGKT